MSKSGLSHLEISAFGDAIQSPVFGKCVTDHSIRGLLECCSFVVYRICRWCVKYCDLNVEDNDPYALHLVPKYTIWYFDLKRYDIIYVMPVCFESFFLKS